MAYDNSAINQNQQGGMNVLGTDPKEKKPQDELVPGQQQPGQDNIVNISGGQQSTITADKGPIRPASTSATSSGQFKNVTRFLDANRKGSTGLVKEVTSKTAEQAAQVGQAINAQKQAYEQQIQQGQQKVQQVGQEKEQYIKNLASGQAMNNDEAQKFKNLLARKDTVIDPNAIKSEADFGKIQGESIAARDVGTLDLSREAEKKRMFEEKMGKVVTDENVRKDFLREAFQSPEKRYTQGMSTLDNLILQSDDVGRQRLQKEVGVQTEATKKTFEQARREGLEKLAGLYGAETDLAKNLVSQISGSRGKIADDVYAAKQQALQNRQEEKERLTRSLQSNLGKIQEDLNLNKITQEQAAKKIMSEDVQVKSALDFIDQGFIDVGSSASNWSSYMNTLADRMTQTPRHIGIVAKNIDSSENNVNNEKEIHNVLQWLPNEVRHIFDVAGRNPNFLKTYADVISSGGYTVENREDTKKEINTNILNLYLSAARQGDTKLLNDPNWVQKASNDIENMKKYKPDLYKAHYGSKDMIDGAKTHMTDEMKGAVLNNLDDIATARQRTRENNKEKLKNSLLSGSINAVSPTEDTYKNYLRKVLGGSGKSVAGDGAPEKYIDSLAKQMVNLGQSQPSIEGQKGLNIGALSRLSQLYDNKSYVDEAYAPYDDILKGHDLTLDVIGTDAEKEAFKNLSSLIGEQNIFDDTKRGITMDRSSATLGNTDRWNEFVKQKQLYFASDKRTKTNIKPANLYKRNALKGLLK